MSLGKVPMKAGGGAKRNASMEQGTQVSTATQRAATTTRHRHTDKFSGDTYQMNTFSHIFDHKYLPLFHLVLSEKVQKYSKLTLSKLPNHQG